MYSFFALFPFLLLDGHKQVVLRTELMASTAGEAVNCYFSPFFSYFALAFATVLRTVCSGGGGRTTGVL